MQDILGRGLVEARGVGEGEDDGPVGGRGHGLDDGFGERARLRGGANEDVGVDGLDHGRKRRVFTLIR